VEKDTSIVNIKHHITLKVLLFLQLKRCLIGVCLKWAR